MIFRSVIWDEMVFCNQNGEISYRPEAVVDGVTAMLSDEMNTPFLRGAILCSKIWYPDPST